MKKILTAICVFGLTIPLLIYGQQKASEKNYYGFFKAPATSTASAPAFSFNGDTNTGFYRSGADEIRMSTAGSDRITILNNGNVGIGTTTPNMALDVVKSTNSTVTYPISVANGGTYDANWGTGIAFGTSSTTPSAALYEAYTATSGVTALKLAAYNNSLVTVMTLQGDGRIGIGSAPSANFTIALNGTIGANSGTAALPTYTFNTANNIGMWYAGSGKLAFSTQGVERLRIDDTGKVGIGITGPTQALDVVGTMKTSAGLLLPSSGGTPSTLAHYEEGTFVSRFNTGLNTSNTDITVSFVRIGKQVTLMFPMTQVTGIAANFWAAPAGGLPARLTPSGAVFTTVVVAESTIGKAGIIIINSGGNEFFVLKYDNSNWTAGAGDGFGGSITYLVP